MKENCQSIWKIALEREITNCSLKNICVEDKNIISKYVFYYNRHYQDNKFFTGNTSIMNDVVL